MDELKTTTDECLKVMHLLCAAESPITAARMAQRLNLGGCVESQRRRVRAIVKTLRDEGEWIVATNFDGYWLTQDRAVWDLYNKEKSISAKHLLGEIGRRQRAAADRKGQAMLFGLDKPQVSTGHS